STGRTHSPFGRPSCARKRPTGRMRNAFGSWLLIRSAATLEVMPISSGPHQALAVFRVIHFLHLDRRNFPEAQARQFVVDHLDRGQQLADLPIERTDRLTAIRHRLASHSGWVAYAVLLIEVLAQLGLQQVAEEEACTADIGIVHPGQGATEKRQRLYTKNSLSPWNISSQHMLDIAQAQPRVADVMVLGPLSIP